MNKNITNRGNKMVFKYEPQIKRQEFLIIDAEVLLGFFSHGQLYRALLGKCRTNVSIQ